MILIAANPYRGRRRPRARVAALARELEALGHHVRVMWDQSERAATLGDARALRGGRCIVAAGGDGTVAAVINELSADVRLAVLPLGNQNLFAGAFGSTTIPSPWPGRSPAAAVARSIWAAFTPRLVHAFSRSC